MGIREVMSALNVLKAVPQADLDKIVAEVEGDPLQKGDMHAEGLKPGEMVHDFRTEGHVDSGPTKQEIRTGPAQESSGAGAARMIADYSPSQAAQMGIVLMAEKFEKLIAPMATSMKALVDGQKSLVDLMTPIAAKAAKAESEDDEEDEEEESEVVEINASRAKSLVAKAEKMIKAAKAMEDEAEDEDDEMKARKARRESRRLMKAAGKLLLRARSRAYAAQTKGKDIRVQIRTLLVKADINVTQEEEEEDEDEEEKAKAGTDAARNQADHPNKDGNQADEAEKSKAVAALAAKAAAGDLDEARVKKALEDMGIPMISMKINELMDTLSGRSRVQAAPVLDLAKAKPNYIEGRLAAIPLAKSAGRLSDTDEAIVKDLLNMHKNVQAGNVDKAILDHRIQLAPRAVQDFIATDLAA